MLTEHAFTIERAVHSERSRLIRLLPRGGLGNKRPDTEAFDPHLFAESLRSRENTPGMRPTAALSSTSCATGSPRAEHIFSFFSITQTDRKIEKQRFRRQSDRKTPNTVPLVPPPASRKTTKRDGFVPHNPCRKAPQTFLGTPLLARSITECTKKRRASRSPVGEP